MLIDQGMPMTGSVPLRHNEDFRRLWIGGALSDLGSRAADLATPLLVLAFTGSPVLAGLIGSVRMAGFVVCALPGGALVDRWERRRTMLAAESVRAVAASILTVAIMANFVSIPVLVALALVDAAAAAVFGPAHTAAIRHVVPADQLGLASARNEARGYAAELAGPPIGGVLFAAARWAPFLADAVSYLASLTAIARIRVRLRDPSPAPDQQADQQVANQPDQRAVPIRGAITEGLRFVWREPFLRVILLLAPLTNVALIGLLFALIVTLRDEGFPAAQIGLVQAAVMAGGLVGAVLAGAVLRRVRPPTLIIVSSWLAAALVLSMAALPVGYVLAAPVFVLMLCGPAENAALFARQIAVTPDAMQGRVEGATGMLSQALSPLGPLVGGILVEYAGHRLAFAALSLVLVAAAVLVTASPAIRGTGASGWPMPDQPDAERPAVVR